MLGIGVIASVVGIAIAFAIDWFPDQGSTQAKKIDDLYDVMLVASVPFFVLVVVVVLFCVWKFRMKPGEEMKDGPPIHGDTRLEAIWTVLPALLLTGLLIYTYIELVDIEKKKPNPLLVNVVGQQFTWTFSYPKGAGTGGKAITSNQLFLPENRPVEFQVRSEDVIHDFWVPEFRMKIDAVPGISTSYRITTVKRPGRYQVVCAELCGLGHATMRQSVHVVPPAQFARWVAKEKGPAVPGGAKAKPEDVTAAGKQIFAGTGGCGACHTLADAGSTATVGPNLDKSLANDTRESILKSIVEPNAVVTPGFPRGVMPANFGKTLSKPELNALVTYLVESAEKK